jgi:GntR family transcriptional regulator
MQLTLDANDNRPIYVQIVDEVRRGLARGTLGPEDPLPSVRELAASLRINPRTVMQAYAALERDGVVYVRRGQGTYVSADVRPNEKERPQLAREVGRRALRDARRSGLELEDLMKALKELGGDSEADGKEGGAG